jgi:hypothetical protein
MAASCSGTVVGSSGDHVRDVALNVAGRKVDDENDIHTFKRPDYTAEEWRWLFMTTGSDYYFNSSRLLGFCGVDGINWAVVTRMRERKILLVNTFLLFCRKIVVPFCIICAHSSGF